MNRVVETTSGEYDLRAELVAAGSGLVVVVTGGQAHLGAAALALPRPSLSDPVRRSADVSSLAVPGHKEDDLARLLAKRLAARLNRAVTVVAGCHWDDLDEAGIDRVLANADELARLIISTGETE